MPDIHVQIKNLPQIKAAFQQAPQLMARELDTAIRRSVYSIEADSKRNTPVLTGALRASTRSQFSPLRGEVGTNVFYDVFVHEGTRYMKGRPYLLHAVESNEQRVTKEFEDAVQRTLDDIGGRT